MLDTCTLDGCDKPRATAGYCRAHYERKRTTGDPGEAAMRNNPGAVQLWVREFIARGDFGTDCIEWPYGRGGADGRGFLTWPKSEGGDGKVVIATHRILAGVGRPRPTPSAFALHSCDNPPCVNPNHLSWGDQRENVRQMHDRGRAADKRGERSARAALTDSIVIEARRLYRLGESDQVRLAEKFGVDSGTMSRAVRGESWSHLNDVEPPSPQQDRSTAQLWVREFVSRESFGSDCVEWPHARNRSGRGRVVWSVEDGGPGVQVPATHRVLAGVGRPRPHDGATVASSCGSPTCVNPNHLRWVTVGSDLSATRRWNTKLTEAIVREARALYASNPTITMGELAERYGVSSSAVSLAVRGVTWCDIEGSVASREKTIRTVNSGLTRLSEADIREIRDVYELIGTPQAEIAERYGVSQRTISNVVRRKTWSHVE